MKKKSLFSSLLVLGLAGVVLAGCGGGSSDSKTSSGASKSESNEKVTIVGSTALQPLVEQAASKYQDANKGATITVQGGGSGTGLSQVQAGSVTIGNSDIFAEQQSGIDAKKSEDHKVAVVGMTPVVNSDVSVKNLSMSQLKDIFTGKVTNWKDVGGKDEQSTVVNRAKGSGTRATFEGAVLGGESAVKAQEQDSNGTVQKIVSTTPGAISYLAFSYAKTDGLHTLSLDNVAPTDKNITTNKWKIWSYEHMYTNGKAKGQARKFIDYMLSDDVQGSLVKKLGYISIHDMKVKKDANGKVSE